MNLTKAQNRCLAKYGTHDEAEIIKLKTSEPQVKTIPVAAKSVQVKMSPEECKALCEGAGVEYLDGYEARIIEYTLSDETVDRDGDIIIQAGIDLSNYVKNPVVLPFHDSRTFPVGNFVRLWVDMTVKCLKGWILFPDERVDPSGMADRAFRFAKSRIMRAGSIGFRGKEVKFPTKEERVLLGMKDYGVIFTEAELVEFSLCPVPSNPNALSSAVKSGALKAMDLLYVETQEDEEIPMKKEELDALLKSERESFDAKLKDAVAEALKSGTTEKAGRRFSAASLAKMKKTLANLEDGYKTLKDMIEEYEKPEDEEEGKTAPASDEDKELEALAAEVKNLVVEVAK